MWNSPDIREHVKEHTDFRMGSIIHYYKFNTKTDSVGEYDYVYAGEYNELIVPDISAEYLMIRLSELINKADVMKFESEANYQSPIISNLRYSNVLLYQFVLFLNRISSNADFTIDKLKDIFLLTQEQLNEFLLDKNRKSPRTLKKIDNITVYETLIKKMEQNSEEPQQAVDDWLNIKIPTANFTNIQDTPFYQLLVSEFGEKFVTNLVTLLDKYEKRKKV